MAIYKIMRCSSCGAPIKESEIRVVYCDPPYEGRTKAHHFTQFDYEEFWQWVRDLSNRCAVFTSCFDCPSDFKTVYAWGDTVHRYTNGKREAKYTDGTCEKLVVWKRI